MIHLIGHGLLGLLAQVYPTSLPTGLPTGVQTIPTTTTTSGTFTINPAATLVVGAIFGTISLFIWKNKGGSPIIGFLWGFFLGLIGLLVVAIAKPKGRYGASAAAAPPQTWQAQQAMPVAAAVPSRPCPHCGQLMQADLGTCPSCQQVSEPWRNVNGVWITKQDGKDWWLNSQSNQWQMYRINKYCPNCLAEMQPTDATCPECGTVSNTLGAPA